MLGGSACMSVRRTLMHTLPPSMGVAHASLTACVAVCSPQQICRSRVSFPCVAYALHSCMRGVRRTKCVSDGSFRLCHRDSLRKEIGGVLLVTDVCDTDRTVSDTLVQACRPNEVVSRAYRQLRILSDALVREVVRQTSFDAWRNSFKRSPVHRAGRT